MTDVGSVRVSGLEFRTDTRGRDPLEP